jgi:hypothetical protein
MQLPSDDMMTQVMQERVTLTPQKFGYVGAYSREMLRAEWDTAGRQAFMFDQVLLKLWTTVLTGRTVSESPTVTISAPADWRQHVKQALNQWHNDMHDLWNGLTPAGDQTTPSPWVILLIPLFLLWPRWFRKHPVRSAGFTGDIHFSQHVLYPQVDDVPARCGMPVIYETLESLWPLSPGLPRYLSKDELLHELYRMPQRSPGAYPGGSDMFQVLEWLESHGVNTNQLVKRSAV